MKLAASLLGLASLASGHAIFQRVSINGVDQGQLKGVRATSSNNPIENVNDAGLACNNNLVFKDSNVLTVPAGARVGAWYQHAIGGPQGANDPDNPIAASHKGPIIIYLAKVSNAATAATSGQKWFKVAEAGLSGSTWAVDSLIANNGWHYFTMPSCVAPGDYLMRVELIALHNAGSAGGAQFYPGCAQIKITGSGTNTGSNTVSFPGAYVASHPGITVSIYQGKPYTIPGPAVLSCSGGSTGGGNTGGGNTGGGNTGGGNTGGGNTGGGNTGGGSGTGAALYAQCGGTGWTGPTTCASGTCKASNEYYSQCMP
ncbi:lytic cellulose monooxygenase (C1-hydroxylating) [Microdochium nivale]|nr:lytic cellulose monooxygenase (C1-hydroxylating) [Microdochium nivale]